MFWTLAGRVYKRQPEEAISNIGISHLEQSSFILLQYCLDRRCFLILGKSRKSRSTVPLVSCRNVSTTNICNDVLPNINCLAELYNGQAVVIDVNAILDFMVDYERHGDE